MKPIGFIDQDRLRNIPKGSRPYHEYCFYLHDTMAGLLVQMEIQKASHVSFTIENDQELELLENGIHPLDFLSETGREDLERRAAINHICIALYADILHFIYEGLIALEKRKFSVAFCLLRKPFKEGLLILAQMCADEEAFFNRFKMDLNELLDFRKLNEEKIKSILENAMRSCECPPLIDADNIYDCFFNRKNDMGLAGMFDKATHLITGFRHIQTENYNLNFIFKNPLDDDVYGEDVYIQISTMLMLLSLIQIELYSRMRKQKDSYKTWAIYTSIGAYEALFAPGRSKTAAHINKMLSEFLRCPMCDAQIRVKKNDIPRLLLGETLDCDNCLTTQHFPFGWLITRLTEQG